MSQPTGEFLEEVKDKRLGALGISRDEIQALLDKRQQHRTNKEWADADAVRAELEGRSILIMDGVDGVEWRVRL